VHAGEKEEGEMAGKMAAENDNKQKKKRKEKN
jgi:hypothetical protein